MNYSKIIHSSLINPAPPKKVDENTSDPVDHVTMDIPLLTRVLELAREDIKSDADLHQVLTRIIGIKNQGILTMQDYEKIAGPAPEPGPDQMELESIKKLAGI